MVDGVTPSGLKIATERDDEQFVLVNRVHTLDCGGAAQFLDWHASHDVDNLDPWEQQPNGRFVIRADLARIPKGYTRCMKCCPDIPDRSPIVTHSTRDYLGSMQAKSLKPHHIGRTVEGLGVLEYFVVTDNGFTLHAEDRTLFLALDGCVSLWSFDVPVITTEYR